MAAEIDLRGLRLVANGRLLFDGNSEEYIRGSFDYSMAILGLFGVNSLAQKRPSYFGKKFFHNKKAFLF